MPEIICLDGGPGQLQLAKHVLFTQGIHSITLIALAKDPTRKPGLERVWLSGCAQPLILPAYDPALHLLQHIRDEAHRFARAGHQRRRAHRQCHSHLEQIPGIGPKRRQWLLAELGGWQAVMQANVDALAGVQGIGPDLARRIYASLHDENKSAI